MTAIEVLEPGELSLNELAAEANLEHALVLESGASMVEHAIKAGAALLAARERFGYGEWKQWVNENLEVGYVQANVYMRVAQYADRVRENQVTTIKAARELLRGAPYGRQSLGKTYLPEWVREEALQLHADGMPREQIAVELNISRTTAYRWTDPSFLERHRRKQRENAALRREAKRRREEQEHTAALKRAVRKAGGARAKAYAKSESLQDDLGQAHSEATDRTEREAWARAGEHYRKMRDEIVRALGVA